MIASHALRREIESAWEQDRNVVQIRVTTDALEGTPTAVPLTPERLRALDLSPTFDSNVTPLEVLVHPRDWADALSEIPGHGETITVDNFLGYRVVR